ncbi:Protein of unknown function [Quadrisphaera granulorum]|uniref:DUF3037 family protein n=1 Tax=Quadrisphaera granulorum TaxID=317664 RepID=A0A316A5M0_9ACTN|nr:DUF3037 domain-containing protein [Quadrisphaera granulorum]PWJ52985.1 Protein of unknown function (DUF3037) [Quadrisphaera granulorum]SZE97150.1 Protein of unknown function [Quadrisphaera granulorum]
MTDTKHRYVYSAVRVVPRPAAAEFANVAVIVGSETTGEWSLHQADDEARIRRFCGAEALTAAHDFLNHVGAEIDLAAFALEDDLPPRGERAAGVGEEWLRSLARSMMHVVQLSPPRPLLAADLSTAVQLAVSNLLVEPDVPRSRGMTKTRLVSDLRRSFAARGLASHLLVRPELTTNGRHPYEAVADMALIDERVLQLTQTWSFRSEDQRLVSRSTRAWAWSMRSLRESGAVLRLATGEWSVPPDVDLQVVCIPPDEGANRDVYQEALAIFEDIDAHHVELDVDTAAARAARLLDRSS